MIAELKQINEELTEIHSTYKSTQEKDESQPIVVNATLSIPNGEKTEDKRHHGAVETFQERYLLIQGIGLFITIIIAGATFFSAKAAKDAASAAREQAQASWKNIEMTRKNIDLTVEQFQRDQRAWVSVKSVKIIAANYPNKEGSIQVDIVNSGKTPALHAEIISMGVGITRQTIKMGPPPSPQIMDIPPSGGGYSMFLGIPKGTPTEIYLRFVISYRDVFQSTELHKTTFCGRWNPIWGDSQHFMDFLTCNEAETMN